MSNINRALARNIYEQCFNAIGNNWILQQLYNFFYKIFFSKDFIFTQDLLIKHKWILKLKKSLLIINMFCMNKVNATYNQLINYRANILTL